MTRENIECHSKTAGMFFDTVFEGGLYPASVGLDKGLQHFGHFSLEVEAVVGYHLGTQTLQAHVSVINRGR